MAKDKFKRTMLSDMPAGEPKRKATEARREIANRMTAVNQLTGGSKGIMGSVGDERRQQLMSELNKLPNRGWTKDK